MHTHWAAPYPGRQHADARSGLRQPLQSATTRDRPGRPLSRSRSGGERRSQPASDAPVAAAAGHRDPITARPISRALSAALILPRQRQLACAAGPRPWQALATLPMSGRPGHVAGISPPSAVRVPCHDTFALFSLCAPNRIPSYGCVSVSSPKTAASGCCPVRKVEAASVLQCGPIIVYWHCLVGLPG
jgi:hypothetical protein